MAVVVALATPNPWPYVYTGTSQPYGGGRQLNPSITAVPVNNPPGVGVPHIVVVDDVLPTQISRGPMSPGIPGQSVDNPPFRHASRSPWLPSVIQAWQPPDPPPVQRGPLSPGIPGQSVDNPPPVHEGRNTWLPSVIAAWQPPNPQPQGPRWLSPGIPGQSVDNPPTRSVAVYIPPLEPWSPQQRQTYNVPVQVVVAAQNPYTPPWLSTVLASWRPSDPQPTLPSKIAATLAPAAVVNNPPFNHPSRWPQTVTAVYSWQPPDPQPTQRGPLNPSFLAVGVDNPPSVGVPRIVVVDDVLPPQQPLKIAAILAPAANPPLGGPRLVGWGIRGYRPQPQIRGPLNPSLTAVPVNNPPFSHPGRWVQTITAALWWQPPDPPPVQRGPLNPSVLAVGVDNPPGVGVPKIVTVDDPPLPQAPFKLPPSILAVPVDNPPFIHEGRSNWLPSIIGQWQAVDPQPTQPAPRVTQGTAVVVQGPYVNTWLATVLAAWQPVNPQPTLPAKLNPSITAVSVDNPPFSHPGRSVWGITVAYSWQPPDPPPVQRGPLNPSTLAVQVDNPPGIGVPHIVVIDDQPFPVQRGPLNPSLLTVPSDNPPFRHMGRWPQAITIRLAWEPPDPQPTQRGPLNPSFLAVPVNNPPFTNFGRTANFGATMAWWTIPPDPQPQKGVINPNIPPQPTPPATQQFTVSGPDVRDLFGPVDGVSYTWAGVNKRTV